MPSELDDKLQARAHKIRDEYQITIQPGTPLDLFVDGLCENPGAMHIGLYAVQEKRVIFAEHFAVGNGTCNEAEYLAVKSGLALLQYLTPPPEVAIRAYSDSQLEVRQVAGEWRASGAMLIYCGHLRKLRRTFPFTLTKIPREQNRMADSLAQKYLSKNSGRCLSLEDGRFNVAKQGRAEVKSHDVYHAVTPQNLHAYLREYNLNGDVREMLRRAGADQREAAIALALQVGEKAADLLERAPAGNLMVANWVRSSRIIVAETIPALVRALEIGDEPEVDYLVGYLSGMEPESDDAPDRPPDAWDGPEDPEPIN